MAAPIIRRSSVTCTAKLENVTIERTGKGCKERQYLFAAFAAFALGAVSKSDTLLDVARDLMPPRDERIAEAPA